MVLSFVFGVTRKDSSESHFPDRNKGCEQNTQPQACVIAKGRIDRLATVWATPRTTQKVTIHGIRRQITEAGPLGDFCFIY
jgi:hypothetical protein